ncbi:MAG TPA: tetratricopeptide repeat protein [Verrucomicrobiae bacterium]|nr:tetratricopeptide repeat protein [Verrucomicrobiae bacterium]
MQPAVASRSALDIALSIGSLLLFIAIIGWGMWFWLKKSEDPARLIFKWVLSAFGLVGMVAVGIYIRNGIERGLDYGVAFFGVALLGALGIYFTLIWRHEIAGLVAKPFGALYDGGDAELDPQAYYSIAQAKRKRGHYNEAIAEIRKQLEKFPTDYTGQLLMAEIQAENLNDLPGAELTIERFCNQPKHAPRNIAFALNSLADWHLKYSLDAEAARQDLQKIVDRLPNTEFALLAQQRIGHLAHPEYLLSAHDRPRVHVPKGIENLGLLQAPSPAPASSDPAQHAQEYVRHLTEHPQDTEAREKLAVIYADHFQRLDLAADQLQQLIDQPNQPSKNVVRWLNLLADLQIRHGTGYDVVSQTLNQIIERYPTMAAAENARNRLDLLKLELKARESKQPVKLGTYEQNIGLKYGNPQRPA